MAISKIITGSLTDDAVTSAKIGTDQVGADALSSSAISGAVDIPANSVGESELSVDYTAQSVPHIIPGVLYPAVGGKGIDGTTTITSFGTDVTISGFPTLKYYYTDIKGSKPIKDPRIGTYFGSQRHKFKSLQLLEQETATHGANVYSIDGREWIRACGDKWVALHNTAGTFVENSTASITTDDHFIEIVGYFNDANFLQWLSGTGNDIFGVAVNGGTRQSNDFAISVATPLANRYVDPASVLNLTFNATPTLGINTLRISNTNGAYVSTCGVELIAHDTASTARKNEIKIPKQNVVSFGKKFEVGSDDLDNAVHPHYDPFSAKTDGSAWTSPTSGNNTANSAASWPTNIDTTYSLGLENWVNGSSYYRPYNGGRVVKYVDSTGVIKTAVTVMPPNARSIANAANLSGGAEKGDDSGGNTSAAAPNDNFKPTFTDQTIATAEDLYEVAKTFHFREFGNGNANGGATGTYKDASMLDTGTNRDIAYVMDDGLTSFSGDDVRTDGTKGTIRTDGINDTYYITFIGTGFTFTNQSGGTTFGSGDDFDFIVDGVVVKSWQNGSTINEKTTVVQNLPYGTHVFQMLNAAAPAVEHMHAKEFTFHQPKKPPIPEDACVIADYMLMADFVPINAQSSNIISKGVRRQNSSRDIFYDETDGDSFSFHTSTQPEGFGVELSGNADSATSFKARISSFGTNIVHRGYASVSRAQIYVDSTSQTTTDDSTNNNYGSYQYIATDKTLGVYNWGANAVAGTNGNITSFEIVTPIHTSHHYQSFETPYLHELIGGDRNMEQTNLVCSPDGKTWDEITRDTSYIGNVVLQTNTDSHTTWTDPPEIPKFDEWRGAYNGRDWFNKDFAIAYDRMICLVPGTYKIVSQCYSNSSGEYSIWTKNGTNGVQQFHPGDGQWISLETIFHLKRGDYVQMKGEYGFGTLSYGNVSITRI